MIKNRTCCVDGTKYEYCPTCSRDIDKPSWMVSYCCENCKKIYEACAGYNMNELTKEEAFEILKDVEIGDINKYSPATQKAIEEITAVKEKQPAPVKEFKKNRK